MNLSITREEVNALPIRRYEGRICVLEGKEDLAAAAADIHRETVVGFDTETRPAFRPGESYLPSLAQLATANAVWLFRLPDSQNELFLGQVLEKLEIVKAGVSVADDLKSLKKSIAFTEQSVVDLGRVAHRHGLKQTGVRNLAALFLGFRIPKGAKTTNWSRRTLSPQQIAYAATDAWACRELYLKFQERGLLENRGQVQIS
ncbi:MAG TPA: 3'-5' exonuclease [Burkholderiales bacterium]|nr:3'-5' exonuclease [Burkholderiales bacterium]